MTSNLDDLEAWARELGDGTLMKPETQALRLQGEAFDGQKIDLGYGLGLTTLNDMVGHNGAIIGYSSFIFAFPEHDMTIVVLGNESNNFTTDATTIGFSLIKALYPDQLTYGRAGRRRVRPPPQAGTSCGTMAIGHGVRRGAGPMRYDPGCGRASPTRRGCR